MPRIAVMDPIGVGLQSPIQKHRHWLDVDYLAALGDPVPHPIGEQGVWHPACPISFV
jgi:hypothetical protein